jgi:Fe-S-cluster-containing dehydrogenase component
MTRGFLLDLNRCTGCQACQLACRIENGFEEAGAWRAVYTFNEPRFPRVPLFHLSLACHHCAQAPCMEHCPARAYSRDPATGAVLLSTELCIGCKYCAWACPFDAPDYDRAAGVMRKCTFCHHRLRDGLKPVCVSLCPAAALDYGELNSGGMEVVPGFPKTDFNPSIRFIPLRGAPPWPDCSAASGPPIESKGGASPHSLPASQIGIKSEWPLAVFSLVAAVLAALAATAAAGAFKPDPLAFLLAGIGGLIVSSLHLGRKLRAWRAALNVRRSWLSREIVIYLVFLALAAGRFFFAPSNTALGWLAAATGFALLFVVDRVYDVALRKPPTHLHSASALLTGVFLAGALLVDPAVLAVAAAVKLVLYVGRKAVFYGAGRPVRPLLSLLRLGFPALWLFLPGGESGLPLMFLIAGELTDRLEYYLELDVLSPRRQIAEDLRTRLDEQQAAGTAQGIAEAR